VACPGTQRGEGRRSSIFAEIASSPRDASSRISACAKSSAALAISFLPAAICSSAWRIRSRVRIPVSEHLFGANSGVKRIPGRVDLGGRPPRPPTDPGLHITRKRIPVSEHLFAWRTTTTARLTDDAERIPVSEFRCQTTPMTNLGGLCLELLSGKGLESAFLEGIGHGSKTLVFETIARLPGGLSEQIAIEGRISW